MFVMEMRRSPTRRFARRYRQAIHTMARQIGLIDAIDDRLKLLKIHLPFHESDHVPQFRLQRLV